MSWLNDDRMCSVADIADRENYFVLLDERDPEGNLSEWLALCRLGIEAECGE